MSKTMEESVKVIANVDLKMLQLDSTLQKSIDSITSDIRVITELAIRSEKPLKIFLYCISGSLLLFSISRIINTIAKFKK
jgi:hypothetical protein